MVYVSGQLAIDPVTREKNTGPVADQTRLCFSNVEAILNEAGSSLSKVLSVTIYIPDVSLWGQVNEVYGGIFGEHKPARAIVPTRDLHYGLKIEVSVIATI